MGWGDRVMVTPNGRGAGRNRLELCMELINETMKCLENNDRECFMMLIEELVRNQCHDGRLVGKEIADGVRKMIHEMWLVSDNEYRCELLKILKELGITILEAMATSVPVITTRVGGPDEIVRDWYNGVKVPPNNVEEIVRAAKILLSNEELRMRIARNARESVLRWYTWDRIARWTKRVYQDTLEEYKTAKWFSLW